MQVRDNNSELLYGLFRSICGWALEMGYKDISGLKNLLKLAMVDVCWNKHTDKSALAAQMAVVADLGISLRNVQYALKTLDELEDLSTGFVKIREIQKEITIILLKQPQTADDILNEVSYLIHAPHDLQKRALKTILKDMEQKGIITETEENGKTYYKTTQPHVSLFDPTDLSARVSGMLTHIDAFNHTLGKPFLNTYFITAAQARGLQTAINEFLLGTGNAYELECSEAGAVTKPYYFYIGSAETMNPNGYSSMHRNVLEVIHARFNDQNSPSLLRNHWYHLTPASAHAVFADVRRFIEREGKSASLNGGELQYRLPFSFYIGLADRQTGKPEEEI